MEFSDADKLLMRRVGKLLAEQADELELRHGTNWAASPEAREAKRLHDRVRREERDLAALRRRLEAQVPRGDLVS